MTILMILCAFWLLIIGNFVLFYFKQKNIELVHFELKEEEKLLASVFSTYMLSGMLGYLNGFMKITGERILFQAYSAFGQKAIEIEFPYKKIAEVRKWNFLGVIPGMLIIMKSDDRHKFIIQSAKRIQGRDKLINVVQSRLVGIDYDTMEILDPGDQNAYLIRGHAYSDSQQYDKAIVDFNKAIELNPKDANAYINRALIYSEMSQYSKAIVDFNKVIELDPKNSGGYAGRGAVHTNTEEYEKAIADYEKAIELEPKSSEFQNIIQGGLEKAKILKKRKFKCGEENLI